MDGYRGGVKTLSLNVVATVLAQCGLDAEPVSLEILKQGARTQVVRVHVTGHKRPTIVLKAVERHGRWHLENEITALSMAETVSSPAVFGEFWDPDDCGWLALEDLGGSSIHELLPSSTQQQARRWYRQLGQQLERLHTIDCPGGFGFLRGERVNQARYQQQRVDSLLAVPLEAKQLHALKSSLAVVESDQSRLANAVLCHQDLHHGNVLIDRSGELCGVIDFENAAAGDPMQDLARSTLLASVRCDSWAAQEVMTGYRSGAALTQSETHRLSFWQLVQAGDMVQAASENSGQEEFVSRVNRALSRISEAGSS